jgi:hypothetical protein
MDKDYVEITVTDSDFSIEYPKKSKYRILLDKTWFFIKISFYGFRRILSITYTCFKTLLMYSSPITTIVYNCVMIFSYIDSAKRGFEFLLFIKDNYQIFKFLGF